MASHSTTPAIDLTDALTSLIARTIRDTFLIHVDHQPDAAGRYAVSHSADDLSRHLAVTLATAGHTPPMTTHILQAIEPFYVRPNPAPVGYLISRPSELTAAVVKLLQASAQPGNA